MKEQSKNPIPVLKSELTHHWQERLKGSNIVEMVMKYKDADYFNHSDPDLDPETVIYEHIVKEADPKEGRLNWGHITLYPGQVKDQYFCTKGHFHTNPEAEEYLLCMQGDGLIMYLSKDGECWCEELEEASLHKVPAGIARRLINIGDEPLMLSQCTPSNAGFDFDSIDEHPFPCHVYDDDGELAILVDVDEQRPNSSMLEEEDIINFLGGNSGENVNN